eukprot:3539585-Pyramimonas_sp.AAC.2
MHPALLAGPAREARLAKLHAERYQTHRTVQGLREGLVGQLKGLTCERDALEVRYTIQPYCPWLVSASVYYATPFVYVRNSGLGP